MTLGRSMMLKTAALILGLMLLAGAALTGISALQQNQELWQQREREVRLLHMVSLEVAAAQDALSSPPYRPQTAAVRLSAARDRLGQVLAQPFSVASLDNFQQQSQHLASQHIRSLLEEASAILSPAATPTQITQAHANLQRAYALLAYLSKQVSDSLQDIQVQQQDQVNFTFLTIGTLSGLIILSAVGIGVWQHLSVMRPLRRLACGVRDISHGRFDQRLPLSGPTELAQVAGDFNHMAEELDNLYHQLEQKVASKSRELVRSERLASVGFLAAGVAHEINNPLGIIAGYAEATAKSLRDSRPGGAPADPAHEQTAQALRIISDEAFRCKEIIKRLLTLARPGSDSREIVSLRKTAQEVAALVAGLTRFGKRRLILDLADNPLRIIADQNEMKQVLLNLVVNALDVVPDGSGIVRITGQTQQQSVQLVVSDNGKGMDSATLERVFEPFFTRSRRAEQGSSREPTAGTGLGLSIVHAIVQAHGGTIVAHSDGPGRGSRFSLTLPAAPTQDSSP